MGTKQGGWSTDDMIFPSVVHKWLKGICFHPYLHLLINCRSPIIISRSSQCFVTIMLHTINLHCPFAPTHFARNKDAFLVGH
jgi:hypothetical protein